MTPQTSNPLSRRAALAGLGVGGLGVALAATTRSASMQDAATDLASHPLMGAWLTVQPGVSVATFGADGSALIDWPSNFVDESGNVVFQTPGVGVWEPVDDRSARFTVVEMYEATPTS